MTAIPTRKTQLVRLKALVISNLVVTTVICAGDPFIEKGWLTSTRGRRSTAIVDIMVVVRCRVALESPRILPPFGFHSQRGFELR